VLLLSICVWARGASADEPPRWDSPDGLPFRYYVARDGALGYSRIQDVGNAAGARRLERGWSVAIVEEGDSGGRRAGRSRAGLWFDLARLERVKPESMRGVAIRDGRLPARVDGVPLDDKQPLAPPEGIAPGERWVDVDLAAQTLVAYEGARPVYAALVSTGIGRPGSRLATPPGVHRIREKRWSADMDNIEHTGVRDRYSVEDVPYVQWFTPRAALHGAFWHRRFGHRNSHGCINLTPLDAQWLYAFTREGTIVRVR
jgi:hypothetical protein